MGWQEFLSSWSQEWIAGMRRSAPSAVAANVGTDDARATWLVAAVHDDRSTTAGIAGGRAVHGTDIPPVDSVQSVAEASRHCRAMRGR